MTPHTVLTGGRGDHYTKLHYNTTQHYSQVAEVVDDDVTVAQQLHIAVQMRQRLTVDKNLRHVRVYRAWWEKAGAGASVTIRYDTTKFNSIVGSARNL